MKNDKTHALLLALVGGYILYLAYQIFSNQQGGAGDMPLAAAIAVIVLFAAGGLFALAYAWRLYRNADKHNDQHGPNDASPKQ